MKTRIILVKITSLIYIFLITLFFLTMPVSTNALQSESEKQIEELSTKIAKDYTNKFCNGIGFGLSKSSAITFTINENKQTFSKKKNIDKINQSDLASQIAYRVIDKCGSPIGLSGQQGQNEFKEFFLAYKEKLENDVK